jgi:hypothetical protein
MPGAPVYRIELTAEREHKLGMLINKQNNEISAWK